MCNKLNNCLPFRVRVCVCEWVSTKEILLRWKKRRCIEEKCTNIRSVCMACSSSFMHLYECNAWCSCAIDARSLNMWMTLFGASMDSLALVDVCVNDIHSLLLWRAIVCAACAAERMSKNILCDGRIRMNIFWCVIFFIFLFSSWIRIWEVKMIVVHSMWFAPIPMHRHHIDISIDVKEVDRTYAQNNNNNKNGCCCGCTTTTPTKYYVRCIHFGFYVGFNWKTAIFLFHT